MKSILCIWAFVFICSISGFAQNETSAKLIWGTIEKEKTEWQHIDNSRIIGQIGDQIYVERWNSKYVFLKGNYIQLFIEVYDKDLNLIKRERIKHSRKKYEPVGLLIDNYNRLVVIISDMAPHLVMARERIGKSKPAFRDIYYQFYDPDRITPKGKLKKIGTIKTARDDSMFGSIRLQEKVSKKEGKQFVVYSTNIIPFNFEKDGSLAKNPKNFMSRRLEEPIKFTIELDGDTETGEISGKVTVKSKTNLFQKEPGETSLSKELFSEGLRNAYKNLSSDLSTRKKTEKPDIRTNQELIQLSDRSYLVLVDVILYYTVISKKQIGGTSSYSKMDVDEYHDLIVFHVSRSGSIKESYSIDRGKLSLLGFIYPVKSYVVDKGNEVNIIHHIVKRQNKIGNLTFQRLDVRKNMKTGLTIIELEEGNKFTKELSSSTENGLEINSKIQSYPSSDNSVIIYGNDKKKKKYALGRITF